MSNSHASDLKKILLLDDDKDLGHLVRRGLKEAIQKVFNVEGWNVELSDARNWEDGRKMAESGAFDVVLLDLALPPMHTVDTVAMIPKIVEAWPPIVVFTGNKSYDIREKCMAYGAASFFLKCIAVMGTGGWEALIQDCINAHERRRRQGL